MFTIWSLQNKLANARSPKYHRMNIIVLLITEKSLTLNYTKIIHPFYSAMSPLITEEGTFWVKVRDYFLIDLVVFLGI